MSKLLATNVGLLAIAIGAITKGLDLVYAHDYIAGGVAVFVGLVVLVVYEKFPPTTT